MNTPPENTAAPPKKKRGKKKGAPKTGGRKKGTPNKNSSTFRASLDEVGFNLTAEYVKTLTELPADLKMSELRFLIKFLYPQLKETEAPPAPDPTKSALEAVPTANLIAFIKPQK